MEICQRLQFVKFQDELRKYKGYVRFINMDQRRLITTALTQGRGDYSVLFDHPNSYEGKMNYSEDFNRMLVMNNPKSY